MDCRTHADRATPTTDCRVAGLRCRSRLRRSSCVDSRVRHPSGRPVARFGCDRRVTGSTRSSCTVKNSGSRKIMRPRSPDLDLGSVVPARVRALGCGWAGCAQQQTQWRASCQLGSGPSRPLHWIASPTCCACGHLSPALITPLERAGARALPGDSLIELWAAALRAGRAFWRDAGDVSVGDRVLRFPGDARSIWNARVMRVGSAFAPGSTCWRRSLISTGHALQPGMVGR
jgi:hypothetical protein